MKIKRREFFKRSALSIGGLVTAGSLGSAAEATPATVDPFEKVSLGKTGLKFSRFCMGTGVSGGNRQSNQTRMGKEKFEALLKGGYDRGVRWFDLADLYGTHPFLTPALKGLPRDGYGIISKIWWAKGGIPEKERPDADVVVRPHEDGIAVENRAVLPDGGQWHRDLHGVAGVDLADLVDAAREEQEPLRHGRLAGVDVGHDAEVADGPHPPLRPRLLVPGLVAHG